MGTGILGLGHGGEGAQGQQQIVEELHGMEREWSSNDKLPTFPRISPLTAHIGPLVICQSG